MQLRESAPEDHGLQKTPKGEGERMKRKNPFG